MYFAGRWVPMEVMNAFFVLWGLSIVVLVIVVFWLRRKGPPEGPKSKAPQDAQRRKHRRRKAR